MLHVRIIIIFIHLSDSYVVKKPSFSFGSSSFFLNLLARFYMSFPPSFLGIAYLFIYFALGGELLSFSRIFEILWHLYIFKCSIGV
jgi:hypothetical protein